MNHHLRPAALCKECVMIHGKSGFLTVQPGLRRQKNNV